MKWWLVLVAFVLGVFVTWLLTMRRDSEPVPTGETAVSAREPLAGGETRRAPSAEPVVDQDHDDVDDASAFGGPPSEFSSEPGAAESWHRDWEDEDALMTRRPTPGAGEAEAVVPPVAEATPNGDLAGVGEPQAVQAVDAKAAEPPAPTGPAGRSERGESTFDADATEGDDAPSNIQSSGN